MILDNKNQEDILNINCVDPLNRSALIAAIENENIELVKLLLEEGIQVKVSLLLKYYLLNITIIIINIYLRMPCYMQSKKNMLKLLNYCYNGRKHIMLLAQLM